ncbi:MAG TPA: hypothetical protein VK130_08205 [Steroidobacteraceae bacterium]|nr:hypothetical protein [Steroidobacteraceae bacterium]
MSAPAPELFVDFLEETLRFALEQRLTPEQIVWEAQLAQADAIAQILIERDPNNRPARAWRADRRAQLAKERVRFFSLGRTPDTSLRVVSKIGGHEA